MLSRAREEAAAEEVRGELAPVFASDISPQAIEIAQFHAKRAGVGKDVRFAVQDMRRFSSAERYGVLISNPPYGERLRCDLFTLYKDFGKVYRSLPDWSCVFLSSYDGAERAFGGKVTKKRHIFNAKLTCSMYTYAGKRPVK